MDDEIDPIKLANEQLSKLEKTTSLTSEQKDMITPMYLALQKEGIVFVGQGPTGMGKTYVIAAVAKALVKSGKRVCIAVPSYAHLNDVMGLHLGNLNEPYAILSGLTHLKEKKDGCPLLDYNFPTSIFCSTAKNSKTGPFSETCKDIDCTVRRELKKVKESQLVLTVYHKLLSQPDLLNDFDVIIFDESHGLEAAVRSYRTSRVGKDDIEVLKGYVKGFDENFDEVAAALDELEGETEVPLGFVENEVIDPLRDIMTQLQEKIQEKEQNKEQIPKEVEKAFYHVQAATRAIEKAGYHRFIPSDGKILAIPHQVTFPVRNVKSISEKLSVGLISATLENQKLHANDSGFPYHTLAAPVVVDAPNITKRFRNRPIIGLIDGPVLRKDPNSMDFYNTARIQANKIFEMILPSFTEPTLVLCRNKQDARSIQQHLESIDNVKTRLHLFDPEEGENDIDKIETAINQKIDEGQNIILTTASSKLWEGANLKKLKLLVVDALMRCQNPMTQRREKDLLLGKRQDHLDSWLEDYSKELED